MNVNKDIYEYIIQFVDIGDVINMLSVNKKFYSEEVLIRIMNKRFPRLGRFKNEETWRCFYVKRLYYIKKLNDIKIPYFPYRKYDPYLFYKNCRNDKKFDIIMVYAARSNRIDIFKSMIEKGATAFNRCLWVFIKKGDMENVNYMMQKGACMYNSALIIAAKYNRVEMANIFVEKGATDYNQALTAAIESGHIDMVNFLLDEYECNYLYKMEEAIEFRHLNIVKVLYEKSNKNFSVVGLIYESIKIGDLEIVKYLLQYEKNVDIKICSMNAVIYGHINIMNYFIETMMIC